MSARKGWNGRTLRIDLTNQSATKRNIPEQFLSDFIGGRGLNMKILYDEVPVGADPLGIENLLIFGVGPLNGTPIGMGRMTVTTKSPASGYFAEGNSGKFFAPNMKFAGYDAIVISGKAESPVYVVIKDDKVEFRRASHLWGKNTFDTELAVKAELGDDTFQVRVIGPAGENLSGLATIMGNNGNAGGRGGAGAVMGSKNLKAIAIKGTGSVDIANPGLFKEAMDEIYEEINYISTKDPYVRPWQIYGTMFIPVVTSAYGAYMTRNAREGLFPEGLDEIRGERIQKDFVTGNLADFCCPYAACIHWLEDRDRENPYGEICFQGVQAGTQISMGSMCGVKDVHGLFKLHDTCNALGICYVSTGTLFAWVMEAYEKGILTLKDTDGIAMEWGNHEGMVQMLHKIAKKEGFGAVLADGVKKASERVGKKSDEFALQIKGLEFTCLEPRAFFLIGLANAVTDIGAHHTKVHVSYPPVLSLIDKEILSDLPFDMIKAYDRQSPEGKGQLVKWLLDTRAVLNCLETCIFTNRGKLFVDYRPYAKALTAATGFDYSDKDLLKVGERVINLERSFNVREGARRKDDTLPRRYLSEPFLSGGSKGKVPPLEKMLDDYYDARGWGKTTGIPSRKKLEDLGLVDVAVELEKYRR
jgi:aldehyde:ferredoxin oxidoreductase